MITILHLTTAVSAQDQIALRFPGVGENPTAELAQVAARLLAKPGSYEAVANFEGDAGSLEEAWAATQNGVRSDSWSRHEPPGLRVIGSGVIDHEGQQFGRRSSDVGDVFVVDRTSFHLVANLGFQEIGQDLECPALARLAD